MEDHLTINEREISGITIFDISGRIDAATSSQVEGELERR